MTAFLESLAEIVSVVAKHFSSMKVNESYITCLNP